MKNVFLLWLLLAGSIAHSQNAQRSSVGMSGSSKTLENVYVSSTIGQQSAIGAFSSEKITLIQGFQQPILQIITLANVQNELKVVVFPNPVNAFLNVHFKQEFDTVAKFTITNVVGQIVRQETRSSVAKIALDLSTLSSGSYVLLIEAQGLSYTTKLIKN